MLLLLHAPAAAAPLCVCRSCTCGPMTASPGSVCVGRGVCLYVCFRGGLRLPGLFAVLASGSICGGRPHPDSALLALSADTHMGERRAHSTYTGKLITLCPLLICPCCHYLCLESILLCAIQPDITHVSLNASLIQLLLYFLFCIFSHPHIFLLLLLLSLRPCSAHHGSQPPRRRGQVPGVSWRRQRAHRL